MTYQVTLIEADVHAPMDGKIWLALEHDGQQMAKLEYSWDATQFTAIFHGHAPSLPVPAHPVLLLQKPISALLAHKTSEHKLITDVFQDHAISIDMGDPK